MKKVFILSALVFITFLGNAQKGLVTKAQSLKEAESSMRLYRILIKLLIHQTTKLTKQSTGPTPGRLGEKCTGNFSVQKC